MIRYMYIIGFIILDLIIGLGFRDFSLFGGGLVY